jgi:hypothetical protein
MRLQRIGQLNPVTLGIEPTTYQLVAESRKTTVNHSQDIRCPTEMNTEVQFSSITVLPAH